MDSSIDAVLRALAELAPAAPTGCLTSRWGGDPIRSALDLAERSGTG